MVYTISMRYAPKRFYEWSPAIAYTVGLITSDGCLQKNGRHIDLTSIDIEQLENFAKALGRSFLIGTKSSGANRTAYRIQFSDVAYYDFLLGTGLTPAKSKTMGPLLIPDQFYADFLRGLFDGDGTCNGYMDPRWKSSFMFYTRFCSASKPFIDFIATNNQKLITGLKGGTLGFKNGVYVLSYAKADSHALYKFMYHSEEHLRLTRKYAKLRAFVERDQADILNRL
jgi:hypothetical protein